MVVTNNRKTKEINLEEKLKKLAEKIDLKPKKETHKKQTTAEDKGSKEILPEKQPLIIEPNQILDNELKNINENKEPIKPETLEQVIADVQTEVAEKKENNPVSANYSIASNLKNAANYQTSKYNPGNTKVNINLNRDQNKNNSPNLISSKLYNPFDASKRDVFSYANNYSSENNADEKDSARMYEETKQKFYEASQRDIHDKRSNKNI